MIRIVARDARDTGRATWQVLQMPLSGRANDYLLAGGVLAGIAATSLLDRSLRHVADSSGGQWAETVSDVGHAYQRVGLTFAAAGAFYVTGLAMDRAPLRRTGQEIIESFCISGLGSQALKHIVGRNRPYVENGPYHLAGFNWKNADQSFPSGDVVVAFSLSTVLAAEAKSWPVSVALYSLASMTAFQRLHRDRHWFSDTVAGAALGSAVGLAVVHAHRTLNNPTPRASIAPSANGVELIVEL